MVKDTSLSGLVHACVLQLLRYKAPWTRTTAGRLSFSQYYLPSCLVFVHQNKDDSKAQRGKILFKATNIF